jgi:hypothetical protein
MAIGNRRRDLEDAFVDRVDAKAEPARCSLGRAESVRTSPEPRLEFGQGAL